MEVKYLIDVSIGMDCDDTPDKAEVSINEALYKRIKLFQKTVKQLDAYQVNEFSYEPTYMIESWDETEDPEHPVYREWDGNIDSNTMDVDDTTVKWSGYIKHTGITADTSHIYINELDECFKVLRCRKETLPLLLGTLESEKAQQLYEERLKGA